MSHRLRLLHVVWTLAVGACSDAGVLASGSDAAVGDVGGAADVAFEPGFVDAASSDFAEVALAPLTLPEPVPPTPPAPWLDDCPVVWTGADGVCRPGVALCESDALAVPSLGCVDIEDGVGSVGAALDLSVAFSSGAPEISLAAGEQVGAFRVDSELTLRGSGARSTVLRAASPEAPVLVVGAGASLVLSDVTVVADGAGIVVEPGGSITLERVRVRAGGGGLSATGAQVVLRRVRFEGDSGELVSLADGCVTEVAESTFTGLAEGFVVSDRESSLVVDDTVFEKPDVPVGEGRLVRSYGPTRLTRTAFRGPAEVALRLGANSSHNELDGVFWSGHDHVLHWTLPALVMARRLHVEGGQVSAFRPFPTLTDFTFTGVRTEGAFFHADKIQKVHWQRGVLSEVNGFPLVATTDVRFDDVRIVSPNAEVFEGRLSPRIELNRVVIDGGFRHGLRLAGILASLDATDLQVLGTKPDGTEYGTGIFATAKASVTLRRSVIDGASTAGVFAYNAHIRLVETRIARVAPGVVPEREQQDIVGVGDGVLALEESEIDIDRCVFHDIHRASVLTESGLGTVSNSRLSGPFGIVSLAALGSLVGEGNRFECETPISSYSELPVPTKPIF